MPTVLITGANRGIGRALAEAYLRRPGHTVVASVRNPDTTTLKDACPADGSRLLLVKIDAASASDPADAVRRMAEHGVTALDVVVAVAGLNPPGAFAEVKDMDLEAMREMFEVNAFAFVPLFKALHLLLKAAAAPRLMAISSNAGQISDMEPTIPVKVGVYGASKAALNYLVRRAHFENPWLTCWLMDPGFVQTDTGNTCAKLWGMQEAPQTLADTATALMRSVDAATRSETSGNFYNFDGTPMSF